MELGRPWPASTVLWGSLSVRLALKTSVAAATALNAQWLRRRAGQCVRLERIWAEGRQVALTSISSARRRQLLSGGTPARASEGANCDTYRQQRARLVRDSTERRR